jgi:hypothetical protein
MPFPFTFSLSVPGISNPFVGQRQAIAQSELDSPRVSVQTNVQLQHGPGLPRRPSPGPSIASPIVPLSRKRGWEPSISGPSLAATSSTSSTGYLDTPARYRDMASEPGRSRSREDLDREIEDLAAGKHCPQPLDACAYTMHVLWSCSFCKVHKYHPSRGLTFITLSLPIYHTRSTLP